MSDRITHASDGTPSIERDHPDEDAPVDPPKCEYCQRELSPEEEERKQTICDVCRADIAERHDAEHIPLEN